MKRPDDKEIDAVITNLYRLLRDHQTGRDLRRRLKHANKVDRRGGTNRVKDGLRRRGEGGPGPTNHVGRPTETAALEDYRVRKTGEDDNGPTGHGEFVAPKDTVREFFERAWANTEKALDHLRVAEEQLASIEKLGFGVPDPDPCDLCAAVDRFAPMRVFSDAGGRLAQKMRLCQWHYDRIRKTGKVPTEQQTLGHHDGVVRVDPSTAGATVVEESA